MARAAVCSKEVVLFLLINSVLLLSLPVFGPFFLLRST